MNFFLRFLYIYLCSKVSSNLHPEKTWVLNTGILVSSMGKGGRLLLRRSCWEFVNTSERMLARPSAADCYSAWFCSITSRED